MILPPMVKGSGFRRAQDASKREEVAREDEALFRKAVGTVSGGAKNPRRRSRGDFSEMRGAAGVGLPDQFPLDFGDEPVKLFLVLLAKE